MDITNYEYDQIAPVKMKNQYGADWFNNIGMALGFKQANTTEDAQDYLKKIQDEIELSD